MTKLRQLDTKFISDFCQIGTCLSNIDCETAGCRRPRAIFVERPVVERLECTPETPCEVTHFPGECQCARIQLERFACFVIGKKTCTKVYRLCPGPNSAPDLAATCRLSQFAMPARGRTFVHEVGKRRSSCLHQSDSRHAGDTTARNIFEREIASALDFGGVALLAIARSKKTVDSLPRYILRRD